MKILSIQSHVAFGYAGNSAAVFPLQRLGHDVYPVLTVTFSNHTGYGATRGPLIAPADVAEVLLGVEERGAFPDVDAVLSGYLGAETMGAVVLDAVGRVKAANPRAVYCCDPVMGDVGRGFFVREGIPEFLRDEVVPRADIVTPNQFELEYLADATIHTQRDLLDAVGRLRSVRAGDRARDERRHRRHAGGHDPDGLRRGLGRLAGDHTDARHGGPRRG